MTTNPLNTTDPITVAIDEDDSEVRKTLAAFIRGAPGCACVGEYANGEAALAGLKRNPVHIVLLDVNLPGIDGVECVRQRAELLPQAQKVMLTVHQDTDTIFQALEAGASGYLLKPVKKAELLQAVQDVVRGGSPMTSSIARKVVQSFRKQPATTGDSLSGLSPRERAVLKLLAEGYIYKEIADQLGVSLWTVSTYAYRIYEKLHVRSRSEALVKYRESAPR